MLVANDDEAAVLVREMAALPAAQRVPVISHWGVTGGRFVKEAGRGACAGRLFGDPDLQLLRRAPGSRCSVSWPPRADFGVRRIEDIESPVGVAHAYDMTHILAKAIDIAGTTRRAAVRDALERVHAHDGLVRRYAPPFTPARHEALGSDNLLMARYRADGVLVPAAK